MGMSMPLLIVLLAGLVFSAVALVLIRNLLKASIALAVVSGILATIMFMLDAPLAALFELSVCAGLITVIFISAVSMTRVHTKAELLELARERRKRFLPLVALVVGLLALSLALMWPHMDSLMANVDAPLSAVTEQDVFWNQRQADLMGQIVMVLVGVYGVLIFFKEREKK